MSLKEVIFFRLPQQLQLKIFGRFQKNMKFNTSLLEVNPDFKSATYSKQSLEVFINDKAEIFNFEFFDCSLDLTKPINWLKDYKNQIESKIMYYGKIDRQNFNIVGDIKYVCEPSRFYFLPFLAFKAIQTKDNKFLKIIKTILKDWTNQNPYLKSIHWTSGIEVGIRSVNLTYTHLVLKSSGLLSEEINTLIKVLILQGYHFLKNHLSLYSSANNHLVAELTGLVTISSYFNNNEVKRNKKKWQDKLYREVLNQINKDGVNMELSTHYHAEVTDHFFNALIFIKQSGYSIPQPILNRFKLMFNFLDHVEYNGSKTQFGDNDEGYLIYPYLESSFSIYQSLLRSAQIAFKLQCATITNTPFDLRNYLMFGDQIFSPSISFTKKAHPNHIFKESGYAFIYDHENQVKVSFDFGKIGDNLMAAHGHSDILHFNFEKNGKSIISDSGTYQYHTKYNLWREYFRGITAHNTISINKKNHAESLTRMSWSKQPLTKLVDYKLNGIEIYIEAETNAFKELGVIHNRKVILNKQDRQVVIEDKLFLCENLKNAVTYEFYLNFAAGISTNLTDDTISASYAQNEFITVTNSKFKPGKL